MGLVPPIACAGTAACVTGCRDPSDVGHHPGLAHCRLAEQRREPVSGRGALHRSQPTGFDLVDAAGGVDVRRNQGILADAAEIVANTVLQIRKRPRVDVAGVGLHLVGELGAQVIVRQT